MKAYVFRRHMPTNKNFHHQYSKENPYYHLFKGEMPVRLPLSMKIPVHVSSPLFKARPGLEQSSDLFFEIPQAFKEFFSMNYQRALLAFAKEIVNPTHPQAMETRRKIFEKYQDTTSYFIADISCTIHQVLSNDVLMSYFLIQEFPHLLFPIHVPLNILDVFPFKEMKPTMKFPVMVTMINHKPCFYISPNSITQYATLRNADSGVFFQQSVPPKLSL